MKITSIEIIQTKIPLLHAYELSKRYGKLTHTYPVIVKIATDEGFIGYGETNPVGKFTGETHHTVWASLVHDLARVLIGKDPTNINAIWEEMEFTIRDNHLAKAAIDIACYDILGKKANMPVHQIIGGALYDSLPIMGSVGGKTIDHIVASALAEKAKGYHSLMVKIGVEPIYDAEKVLAVRNAVGKNYPIIIDANQGYDRQSALDFINIAKEANPVLFEQPIDAEDFEGIAKIRSICNIPIAVDESLLSFRHALEAIRTKAADVFSIKVCKNGGIRRSLEIIELARTNGVEILFNSMIEEGITQAASLNLGLTTSNTFKYGHAYFSPLRLIEDITNYSSLIKDGRVYAPQKPGLGINVLEDVLDKYVTERKIIS